MCIFLKDREESKTLQHNNINHLCCPAVRIGNIVNINLFHPNLANKDSLLACVYEVKLFHYAVIAQGGDTTTLNNIFPEQLLVDILAERFQVM